MIKDGKVYDEVWIMEYDKPRKKLIYSVVDEMSWFKTGTDRYYNLVGERCGASNSNSIMRKPENIFRTKEELVNSL
jgi:hypothetical protein